MKRVRITEPGRPSATRTVPLHTFITENADEPELVHELCSHGMLVVGGGSAPVFHIELAR